MPKTAPPLPMKCSCGHLERHPDPDTGLCGWCVFDLQQEARAEAEMDRLRDEDADRHSGFAPTGEYFDRRD